MKTDEYGNFDATALAQLVASQQVSPRELVEAATARLDAVNPSLNAVIHDLRAQALRTAVADLPGGPFRGVPFLVKDYDGELAEAPFNAGTRSLVGHTSPHDSELFARYRRAGVVFLGKTNTPEFGLSVVTEPTLHGATRNPWNRGHTPGGSSGGSAAAVAAGIVPVAHGGDGGGSIRIPASACGLFGLKPSRGRMPLGPDCGEIWHGLVVPHVISRSVRDSAAFLDISHGPDVGAPFEIRAPERPFVQEVGRDPGRLRIAFTKRPLLGEHTDPECCRAVDDAVKLLASLGHGLQEEHPSFDMPEVRLAFLSILATGAAASVARVEELTRRRVTSRDVEPTTWLLKQVADALSATELEAARNTIARMSRQLGAFFQRHDLLLTPTLAYPPPRIGEQGLKPLERAGLAVLRAAPLKPALLGVVNQLAASLLEKAPNTMLFNMTGQPAMSVPLSMSSAGLPLGIQLAAPFGAEALLLRVASQLEVVVPWEPRLRHLTAGPALS